MQFALEDQDLVAYSHGQRVVLDTLAPHIIHKRLISQHWRRPIADLAANVRLITADLPLGPTREVATKVSLLTGSPEIDPRDPSGKLLVRYRNR